LNKSTSTELVCVEKNFPYTLSTLISSPKGAVKQLRSNLCWAAMLATGHAQNLSLYWVNLEQERWGKIYRAPVAMNNKSSHLAVVGDSNENTRCYLVERFAKNYHISWYTPGRKANPSHSYTLYFLDSKEDNILFVDSINNNNRMIVVSQDKKHRNGIASLKVIILQHNNLHSAPVCKRRILLRDYHAPVGLTMNEDGFLLIAHKETLGWIDTSLTEVMCAKRPDGYINTKEREAKRFHILQPPSLGMVVILVWVPSVRDACMKAILFDEKGNEIKRLMSPFEFGVDINNCLVEPRVFALGNLFFGCQNCETTNYVKSFRVVF